MKYVLITGVATGIGYAAASDLARRGYHVFGSVRREVDAVRVKAELGENFTPLLFDVTDVGRIETAVSQVQLTVGADGLYGLVNNAGIAVAGPLQHLPLAEIRRQFEVNVMGALAVTQACLPLLGARRDAPQPPGRIINVSSVSGRTTFPFFGPYAASKHALESFSDALRRELRLYRIPVILVAPGPIQTPIWDKAEQLPVSRFAGTDYEPILARVKETAVRRGRRGLPVEKVARVIRRALEARRPRPRYPVVRSKLLNWWLPQIVPDWLLDWIVGRSLGIDRRLET